MIGFLKPRRKTTTAYNPVARKYSSLDEQKAVLSNYYHGCNYYYNNGHTWEYKGSKRHIFYAKTHESKTNFDPNKQLRIYVCMHKTRKDLVLFEPFSDAPYGVYNFPVDYEGGNKFHPIAGADYYEQMYKFNFKQLGEVPHYFAEAYEMLFTSTDEYFDYGEYVLFPMDVTAIELMTMLKTGEMNVFYDKQRFTEYGRFMNVDTGINYFPGSFNGAITLDFVLPENATTYRDVFLFKAEIIIGNYLKIQRDVFLEERIKRFLEKINEETETMIDSYCLSSEEIADIRNNLDLFNSSAKKAFDDFIKARGDADDEISSLYDDMWKMYMRNLLPDKPEAKFADLFNGTFKIEIDSDYCCDEHIKFLKSEIRDLEKLINRVDNKAKYKAQKEKLSAELASLENDSNARRCYVDGKLMDIGIYSSKWCEKHVSLISEHLHLMYAKVNECTGYYPTYLETIKKYDKFNRFFKFSFEDFKSKVWPDRLV